MVWCRDGVDMCGSICRNGVAVDDICRDAVEMCPSGGGTAITATLTFAPTPANPGGPGAGGTFTELQDETVNIGTGFNKVVHMVLSNLQGGDGGPYTVDYSGVTWGITNDEQGTGSFTDINAQWTSVPAAGAPTTNGEQVVAGASGSNGNTIPAGSTHTGVLAGNLSALTVWPRTTIPFAANDIVTYSYQISGTITVTDSSGNSQTFTGSHSDNYDIDVGTGGGGGGGGPIP